MAKRRKSLGLKVFGHIAAIGLAGLAGLGAYKGSTYFLRDRNDDQDDHPGYTELPGENDYED